MRCHPAVEKDVELKKGSVPIWPAFGLSPSLADVGSGLLLPYSQLSLHSACLCYSTVVEAQLGSVSPCASASRAVGAAGMSLAPVAAAQGLLRFRPQSVPASSS